MSGNLDYLQETIVVEFIRDYKQQGFSGEEIRDALKASAKVILGNPRPMTDAELNNILSSLNDLLGAEGIQERM